MPEEEDPKSPAKPRPMFNSMASELLRQRLVIEGYYNLPEITEQTISDFLKGLAKVVGMRLQFEPIVFSPDKFGDSLQKGINGFVAWIPSGAHIYTWRDLKFFTTDIYSCRRFDPLETVNYTRDFFKSTKLEYKEV